MNYITYMLFFYYTRCFRVNGMNEKITDRRQAKNRMGRTSRIATRASHIFFHLFAYNIFRVPCRAKLYVIKIQYNSTKI